VKKKNRVGRKAGVKKKRGEDWYEKRRVKKEGGRCKIRQWVYAGSTEARLKTQKKAKAA